MEETTDGPVGLTDYILGFRAACLNRAVDIRNFADGRDSFVIDTNERTRLVRLTEMLTEQLEFLQDAWETMLRYADEYDIDLDTDDAFKALEFAREHALKVTEQAYYISDGFLFPQNDGGHSVDTCNGANKTGEEEKTTQAQSTTAGEGRNVGYPRGTKTKAMSNAINCNQAVYASIETITTITENEATFLPEKQSTNTLDQERGEENIREESKYEDPGEITVLDDLMITLEKTIEESIKGIEANREKRSGENIHSAVAPTGTKADCHTVGSSREECNPEDRRKRSKEREEQHGAVRMPREITGSEENKKRGRAERTEIELIRSSRYELTEEHERESEITFPIGRKEGMTTPEARIIARIGIGRRKRIAAQGWHIRQQYEARQDNKAITSCAITVTMGETTYLASCYTKNEIEGAHIFRCPTPYVAQNLKNKDNEIDHPRGEKDTDVDATLWLTQTMGNN